MLCDHCIECCVIKAILTKTNDLDPYLCHNWIKVFMAPIGVVPINYVNWLCQVVAEKDRAFTVCATIV